MHIEIFESIDHRMVTGHLEEGQLVGRRLGGWAVASAPAQPAAKKGILH